MWKLCFRSVAGDRLVRLEQVSALGGDMRGWVLVLVASCAIEDVRDGTPVDVEPAPPVLRRITAPQYHHAIRDLFGPDVVLPTQLEPDLRVEGLASIGAALATVSARGVEQYEDAAFLVAEQVVTPERSGWIPCTPEGIVDDACAREALGWLAWRAWRRPVTPDELEALVAVAGLAAGELGDFHLGLSYGVAASLQAPSFLYRDCLLYTSPSPRDKRQSRMPSSA